MSERHYLPGVLALISEQVSHQAAVELCRRRGGRDVWVSDHPELGHELVEIVGIDHARGIARLVGRGALSIPLGSLGGQFGRRQRIEALLREGKSHPQIAAEVDVSQRTVERVAADLRDDRQGELPL